MISLLSKPAAPRALAAGAVALLILCAFLAVSAVYYRGACKTEAAKHRATALEYSGKLALEQTASALLRETLADREKVIDGLKLQADRAHRALGKERAAAARRASIIAGARPAASKPEGIVDDETSRRVIRHLNSALQRP